MTSNRPYLIRALYEWLCDNDLTPHLLVDAEAEGVEVPAQFIDNGQIVLNVSPGAVSGLELGNELIRFSARFGGVAHDVFVPPSAVLGIYARENGRGMLFPDDPPNEPGAEPLADDDSEPSPPEGGGGRPSLKIVK